MSVLGVTTRAPGWVGWMGLSRFPGVRCPMLVRVRGGGDASPVFFLCFFPPYKGIKTDKKHEVSAIINRKNILIGSLII